MDYIQEKYYTCFGFGFQFGLYVCSDLQSAQFSHCGSYNLTAHRLSLISPSLSFWGSIGFQEQVSLRMFGF